MTQIPFTGDKAPAFTLPNQNGVDVSLKDFSGKWLVLYFYPKDNTPGCTTEAIDFSKALPQFEKLNTSVVGVSPDSTKSHCNFIDKQKLTITLLSDPEKKMISKYGLWVEKTLYGRKYMGVERSTYLIDPKGKIAHAWIRVKIPGHVAEVLATLQILQKT